MSDNNDDKHVDTEAVDEDVVPRRRRWSNRTAEPVRSHQGDDDGGDISLVNIEEEMRTSYLDYAMSVIVSELCGRT